MKKLEISIVVLVLLAFILKALLVPGGAILTGLGLTVLAILYYPSSIFLFNSIPARKMFKKESYKELTFLRGFGSVVTGIVFSIVLTGIMFKDLLLPGADVMLFVGLVGCLIVLVILLIKYFQTKGFHFYRHMLVRVFAIAISGAIMFFTPGTVLVSFFYRDHPEYIKAYKAHAEDPENVELLKKLDGEAQKID